ncbi:PREDICTED: putative 3,4-dihydroxy-2-butanone kinase isoform X2 [Dinoponera quadriceps]|uniref:3,4-dihydroxy-2-butanone kinase isoform X2 n=1 Tax=Dinoponera quadriceps TaxID=609295 RepID=A0A6P3YAY2_DINQU|nr:PREDICTED: putative 3,4-dihydroxy-2-butanone kinase isoform X2 [Dinoponera quadriceps]
MSYAEGEYFQTYESSIENMGPTLQIQNSPVFLVALSFACEALISCAKQLNIIDEECGSGNYGSTLAQSASVIKIEVKENRISTTRPSVALTQISRIIERESDGLEGGIYSLFFDAAAKSFEKFQNDEQLTADMWLTALTSANQAISEVSGMSIGDRSMLDALIPAELKLKDALDLGLNPVSAFGKAVEAAETSAMQTLHMPEHRFGFTNYKTFKYPDPGAHAVGIWMRAAYEGVKLKYGC